MNRLSSLNIDSEFRKLVTAVFHYDDCYIDDGLRRYDITQALHLYLTRKGYQTVVFYSVAKGFHSYDREMLSRFFSEVGQEAKSSEGDHVVNDVITSPKRGTRLMERRRRGTVDKQTQETAVNVSRPDDNIYQEDLFWRTKSANRLANMQQFIYNLRKRENLAIIVRADETVSEFDDRYLSEFTEALSDMQDSSSRSEAEGRNNRLLVLINANHCRNKIMSLFNPHDQHPSIFLRGKFKVWFTKIPTDAENDEQRILNFTHSYVIPSPTALDIRNVIQLSRMESGMEKPVIWADMDNICEQFAIKDDTTIDVMYKEMKRKNGYTYADFKPDGIKKVGDAEQELNEFIGLAGVKIQIEDLKNRVELAIERGEDISLMNKHLVFYGNPGTGKTTIARIVARIYKDMGLISKGHVVEVSKEHLCGQYVGQTAIKTQHVIDSALDGVLFVDEAYRLAEGGENDYGKEAVDTLLARMENDRDRLVVIFAGYEADMQRLYQMNDGLPSRINSYIEFADYSVDELREIFKKLVKDKYTITPEVEAVLTDAIKYGIMYKRRSGDGRYKFANARWIRNLVEKIEFNVARRRKSPDPAMRDISVLLVSDFEIRDMKEMAGFEPGVTKTEIEYDTPIDQNKLCNQKY